MRIYIIPMLNSKNLRPFLLSPYSRLRCKAAAFARLRLAARALCALTWALLLGLGLSTVVPCVVSAGATLRAADVVKQISDQVIGILRDKSLSREEQRQRVEEIANQRFDFETVGRLVLARGWRQLSAQQQREFLAEFKRHLTLSYGSRLDRYGNEKVEITGERTEPRGDVTVRTKIVGGPYENTLVDYRLRQKNGTWYLIDVVVEGISFVSSYRSQFQEVMSQSGPDGLLRQLRGKNLSGQLADGTPPAKP